MAALNQIQGGRWDEVLRRLFSMKQGAVAPTVAAEIVSNIILENDRPENLALAGTRLWTIPRFQAAVAATFQMVQAFNPVGSGTLSIITSIKAWTSSGNRTFDAFLGDTALSTASLNAIRLDTRLINFAIGATFRPTTEGRHEDAAASVAGSLIVQLRPTSNTTLELLERPVVLKPGTGVFVRPDTQNSILGITFQGYERALNPSEEFDR